MRCLEGVVCLLAAAGRLDAGQPAREAGFAEEFRERSAAFPVERFRFSVAAALNDEPQAHQRLPPMWPLVQSSPRRYFSSQVFEFVGVEPLELGGALRLLAYDYGFGDVGKGIDEDVGMGGNEELGADRGFDQKFGDFRDDVGVEAEFRFFEADDGRRLGMAEYRKQAKVAEGAVGEPFSRHRVAQTYVRERNIRTWHPCYIDTYIFYILIESP